MRGNLGIAQHVHFIGKQDNVFLLLSSTDVFVMPSELESFGLAALEAMACGVPCVTSNTGGLPELVKDGINGFSANVGDVDKMAEHVLHLLDSETDYQKFSDQTRQVRL